MPIPRKIILIPAEADAEAIEFDIPADWLADMKTQLLPKMALFEKLEARREAGERLRARLGITLTMIMEAAEYSVTMGWSPSTDEAAIQIIAYFQSEAEKGEHPS